MNVLRFEIDGPLLINPMIHKDERGDFIESFSKRQFEKHGIPTEFVQDNQSRSMKNVIRGLHFQNEPHAQGKLVRVTSGSVLDVIVDIRPDSPTLGMHLKFLLDDQNCNILWVPKGFAHGFLSLTENTVFCYKCTDYYNKESESGIHWNDTTLNIDWGVAVPTVSDKDSQLPTFNEYIASVQGVKSS
ncbi:MAG: hypothetical protein RL090_1530 [Bacteroidota bacterium]|jgi:dTDP-4-dehydrorhamnose 3,5-epimerase